MSARQPKRIALAAWLGLLALAIQSLVPALVAAEIASATPRAGESIFTDCVFGHPDRLADQPGTKSDRSLGDHHHQGTICPICIALQASPSFTAAANIPLPLPSDRPLDTLVASVVPASASVATVAYRSRAPPLA